jgi:hypothetical protein
LKIILFSSNETDKPFILCIQTKRQKERLLHFGDLKMICADATHNIGPKLKLTTLMTVNEYFEGEPLAFCICESESTERMMEFFGAIRDNIGRPIKTATFVSDDSNTFFNAWVSKMCQDSPLPKKRLCEWHVNCNWTAKLNTIPNLPVADQSNLRKETKTKLFDLRTELDKNVFNQKLESFLSYLQSNENLANFNAYFLKYYANRVEQWAHAHLPEDGGCNTNMYLEAWHKTLKYKYLGGKRQKRLDFVCDRLIQADNDAKKAKERYDLLGHRNHRTAKVRTSHKQAKKLWNEGSLKITRQDTTEHVNQFVVEDENSFNVVTQITEDPLHKCPFQCKPCSTCLHIFYCSCREFRVKMNPCVHLHAISFDKKNRFNFDDSTNQSNTESESCTLQSDDTDDAPEIELFQDDSEYFAATQDEDTQLTQAQNDLELKLEQLVITARSRMPKNIQTLKTAMEEVQKLQDKFNQLFEPTIDEVSSFQTTPSKNKRLDKQQRRSPKKRFCSQK